ncbi:MAG: UPF0182 family protein [bacterium]
MDKIKPNKKLLFLFAILFLISISSGQFFYLYSELLWFNALGYKSVFWTIFLAKIAIGIVCGLAFLALYFINLYIARFLGPTKLKWDFPVRRQDIDQIISVEPRYINWFLFAIGLVFAILMGIWPALIKWDSILQFIKQVPFLKPDPIFNKDIGFFVFSLPIHIFFQQWLFSTFLIITLASGIIYLKDRAIHLQLGNFNFIPRAKAHLSILCGIMLILWAWAVRLKMFNLLYSPRGVAFGASYTDMKAQMLAYWVLTIIALACAILFWINISTKGFKIPIIGLAVLIVLGILLNIVYPSFLQKFIVVPNELTKEMPYIKNNITYTRQGYNLDNIMEKEFFASSDLTASDIKANAPTIDNIKIWDTKPLKDTYRELQGLRLYYKFLSIDEDRYFVNDKYTQMMLSPRELIQEQLAPQAKTWENLHFQYTHGYGLCLSPVNYVTEKGLPKLLIKDIPPISDIGQDITRPEMYYGESSFNYVMVNSKANEFDYPKGDQNVYTKYAGRGGVSIGTLWRKLVFSFRFKDPKIFLTSYITPESRIMFHRQIKERVRTLAPFLKLDNDPYSVIVNGRIVWIQDAYTVTSQYPYSEPYELPLDETFTPPRRPLQGLKGQAYFFRRKINYIRNSVKVVIDAYNGEVNFYISDNKDPLIKVYEKIFPALFKNIVDMPKDIRDHIRYPRDLFELQSKVYATYHMQEPRVFYNREDLWAAPLERGMQTQNYEQEMKPYYLIMKLPEEEREEFLLMVPFTPNDKTNMVALICARCDREHYGKVFVYKLPKDKLIYGPRQIDARIDQQTEISSELTLWSQEGSTVFRGHLIVIPINQSIIFIEPVYLLASSGELPELKRVIAVFEDKIAMRHNVKEALNAIFEIDEAEEIIGGAPIEIEAIRGDESLSDLAAQAINYLNKAQNRLQDDLDWEGFGKNLDQLETILKLMQRSTLNEE